MMLSDHFSYDEAIASETASRAGISNIPNTATLDIMYRAAAKLEKVRIILDNKPMHINSWYRSPMLNAGIGGAKNSQHMAGEAIDFICPTFGDCFQICKAILAVDSLIQFDQLILEHSWVHISFDILTNKPRKQVLSLLDNGHYAVSLTDKKGKNLE